VRRLVILLSLTVVLAAVVAAIADVALNPQGTDGVVFGRLRVRNTPGRPCLNLQLLPTDPPSPETNDLYIVDDVGRHELCFESSGGPYCIAATPQPTLTPFVRAQNVRNTPTPSPTIVPTRSPYVPPEYVS